MNPNDVVYTQGATIPPYMAGGVYAPGVPPGVPGASPNPAIERGAPPSTYAVQATLEGQNGALLRLLGLTALRAIFIAPGLWVGAKVTGVQVAAPQLVIVSLASSTTISAGMLAWYWLNSMVRGKAAG